jgi:hypothetical protein
MTCVRTIQVLAALGLSVSKVAKAIPTKWPTRPDGSAVTKHQLRGGLLVKLEQRHWRPSEVNPAPVRVMDGWTEWTQ